jgi:uncharacterized protein (TIGR00661 family)
MKKSRILVAPLDWGLGHASRCIPVIQGLLDLGMEVLPAGDGKSLELLKKEFPSLNFLDLPNFPITYPQTASMTIHMMGQLPKMFAQIKMEHKLLGQIILDENISAIISDNRYGLYNDNITSVLITHQLQPKTGFFERWPRKLVHRLIRNFQQCWVPDLSGKDALAGELSQNKHLSSISTYIGPLSRFKIQDGTAKYDVLAILSGPEPHRSLFERIVLEKLNLINGNHILVRGTNSQRDQLPESTNIEIFDILSTVDLQEKISTSRYLLSRSGYSSIMDFYALGKRALIVPTPGQYEQEYLAQYHKNKSYFVVQTEKELDIKKAMKALDALHDPFPVSSGENLKVILTDFCDALY